MVAGLRRHGLPGLQGDVRRVAGHHVHGAGEIVERGGHVPVAQVGAGAGEVALGPAVRGLVELDRVHHRSRHLVDERPGDRPRAGAQVHDDRGPAGGEHPAGLLDRPAGQQLGLGAGHEDAGPDPQLHVAEVREAGQVLQRLAGGAAGTSSSYAATRPGSTSSTSTAGRGWCRARGPAAPRRRARGWPPRRPRAGRWRRRAGRVGPRRVGRSPAQSSRASSRAARSASMQESRTGWRSPSSTWSRL